MTALSSLAHVLPPATIEAWVPVAAAAPHDGILMGGTALAVHLRHRTSRDLDVFTTAPFDAGELANKLSEYGAFAVTSVGDGTLNGVFEKAKVQFLRTRGQRVLVPPTQVDGMNVGSIDDILATKVKVVGDRAELRDLFDLRAIEMQAHRTVEEGLQLYMARFGVGPTHTSVAHIIKGLGYFDDLGDDPYLEDEFGSELKDELISYWTTRQRQIISSFDPYAS